MDDWQIFVEPEGEWITLPSDPAEDPVEFAESTVRELGLDPTDTLIGFQVRVFTERAQQVDAVVAGVLPAIDLTGVLAYLEIASVPVGPDGPPTDLDDLAVVLRPRSDAWHDVSQPTLPIGQVVRVHAIDPEADPTAASQPVVEYLSYTLPEPSGENVVALTISWTELASSEQMVELADAAAETLRFEPDPGG